MFLLQIVYLITLKKKILLHLKKSRNMIFFFNKANEINITIDDSSRTRCTKENHPKIIQSLVKVHKTADTEIKNQKKQESYRLTPIQDKWCLHQS